VIIFYLLIRHISKFEVIALIIIHLTYIIINVKIIIIINVFIYFY